MNKEEVCRLALQHWNSLPKYLRSRYKKGGFPEYFANHLDRGWSFLGSAPDKAAQHEARVKQYIEWMKEIKFVI